MEKYKFLTGVNRENYKHERDRYDSEKTLSVKEKKIYSKGKDYETKMESDKTREKYYSDVKKDHKKDIKNENNNSRVNKEKFYSEKRERSRSKSYNKYRNKDYKDQINRDNNKSYHRSHSKNNTKYRSRSPNNYGENKRNKFLKINNLPTEISEIDVQELLNWGFIAFLVTESEGKPISNVFRSDDQVSFFVEMRSEKELENALKLKQIKIFDRDITIEKAYNFMPNNKGKFN